MAKMKSKVIGIKEMKILPVKDGTCPVCAVSHEPVDAVWIKVYGADKVAVVKKYVEPETQEDKP